MKNAEVINSALRQLNRNYPQHGIESFQTWLCCVDQTLDIAKQLDYENDVQKEKLLKTLRAFMRKYVSSEHNKETFALANELQEKLK